MCDRKVVPFQIRYMARLGHELRAYCYNVIPIKLGTKIPNIEGWQKFKTQPDDITGWIKGRQKNDGIGITTEKTPVIDIDVLDAGFVREYLIEVESKLGYVPVRTGNAPKCAMLFRATMPFSKMTSAGYIDAEGRKARVEILGKGQQFVAYGVHPDTRRPYEWTREFSPETVPVEDLRVLTAEGARFAVDLFEQMAEARGWQRMGSGTGAQASQPISDDDSLGQDAGPLGLTADELRSYVMAIPNSGADEQSDEVWQRVSMAIKGELGDEGSEIALPWSEQYSGHDDAKFWQRWRSFESGTYHGRPVTARYIIKLAKEYGWQPSQQPGEGGPTPYRWIEPASIPLRRWVSGTHLIRGYVSSTVAIGGGGKTTLLVIEALAMVTGKPLLGEAVGEPLRVWLISTEDPLEELQRRVQAACIHYNITEADIGGRLFIDAGRKAAAVVATETRDGVKIATPKVNALRAGIKERQIDVLMIDPLADSHRVNENDNKKIGEVMDIWADIAEELDIAIELAHHARKPASGADQTVSWADARGAVTIINKSRDSRVMNRMSAKEAGMAGIPNPRSYFSLFSAKANLVPPPEKVDWYRFVGEPLGNGGDELGDDGDNIGVIEPWSWPDVVGEITTDKIREIQLLVSKGRYGAAPQAADWIGIACAEVLGIDLKIEGKRALVSRVVADLRKTRAIKSIEGEDRYRHKRQFIEVDQWVNNTSELADEPL